MNWAAFFMLWLTWLWLDADLTPLRVLLGAGLAWLALLGEERLLTKKPDKLRPLKLVWLMLAFAGNLVRSTAKVALNVVRPKQQFRPAVLAFPLKIRTPNQLAALANAVTLTPGTVTVDIAKDRSVLYLHVLDARDLELVHEEVRGMERRIAEAIA